MCCHKDRHMKDISKLSGRNQVTAKGNFIFYYYFIIIIIIIIIKGNFKMIIGSNFKKSIAE